MTNKSGRLGTAAETAVCKVFKDAGFRAKRLTLHGNKDVGDLDIGVDEVVVEVKGGKAAENASDGKVAEWLHETRVERDNAGAQVGILVVKRKGIGPANAGRWWAITTLTELDVLMGGTNPLIYRPQPVRLHLDAVVSLIKDVYTIRKEAQ